MKSADKEEIVKLSSYMKIRTRFDSFILYFVNFLKPIFYLFLAEIAKVDSFVLLNDV